MADYIPQVSRNDVIRIIARDYNAIDCDTILSMLQEYGTESWHGESYRVQLAILKLAGGETSEIRKYIDIAKSDYRDVIAPAEYPRFFEIGFVGVEKLDRKELKQLKAADWQQYQDWLDKK